MFLREPRKLVALVGAFAVLSFGAAACGDDDDGAKVRETGPGASGGSGSGSGSASGTGSGSGSATEEAECVFVGESSAAPTATVQALLAEFTIIPIPNNVPAGTVRFVAVNEGAEPHELVIVRFEGDPADLPVGPDGAADEAQLPEGAFIGEIEGFASNNTCAAAFDLTPGKYALFCNIVEESENEAHYDMGMHTTFTVT